MGPGGLCGDSGLQAFCDAFLLLPQPGQEGGGPSGGERPGLGRAVCWALWDQLWGDRDACVTGVPQRTFWGVGHAAGFSHLAGQDGGGRGQGQVTEGLDSTGVWADMLQAQAGAGQGCSEPRTVWGLAPGRHALPHMGSPGPSLSPWAGGRCAGGRPTSSSVGRAGGSEPALSCGLVGIRLLGDCGRLGRL